MAEQEFPNGLFVKAPREGAPDFVKGAISLKREEVIEWLQGKDDEWINLDVKEGKSGKWYASVNTWKKEDAGNGGASSSTSSSPKVEDVSVEDIPF